MEHGAWLLRFVQMATTGERRDGSELGVAVQLRFSAGTAQVVSAVRSKLGMWSGAPAGSVSIASGRCADALMQWVATSRPLATRVWRGAAPTQR